jgi:proteasome lid subunit RPN8/RPN11
MRLELQQEVRERIERHGAETYPHECIGILLGRDQVGCRAVTEIIPMENAWNRAEANPYEAGPGDSTRNRSLVDPKDYLRAEHEARNRGMDIVGFYHSHPDHPARPSEFDRRNAWPWFSYVILAVENGVPREMTAWVLSEDRDRFLLEPISIK